MYQRPRSRNLTYLALGGVFLLALIFSSVPSASAGRPLPSPAVEITEALTNTPTPTVTATTSPIYFSNPTLPSCVGAGCSLPSGYNNVVGATLNEQSLHAYDPSSKYWTGGGRVETKIRVNGAGIGTVRLYYAYNGVNCASGYAVYVFKLSGNVNYPNLPLSGYFDVTVTSSDQGSFSFYTRCSSSGSYTGEYGIDSLWYSLVEPATPAPTATATLTSTPTNTPTSSPTITPTPNQQGSGMCWESGPSWPVYTVTYDIDTSTIPSSWVSSIYLAAQTWNDVTPSHFSFFRQSGSSNTVRYEIPDNPGWLAATTHLPGSGPYELAYIQINPNYQWDYHIPPAAGMYSVQNVVTHEFGHWLSLTDIYHPYCSEVTMYHSIDNNGEIKKIDLEIPDINGINYQYP